MPKKQTSRNPSVSLGSAQELFIAEVIKSGRFTTRSEVVRAALRLLQESEVTRQARNAQAPSLDGLVDVKRRNRILKELDDAEGW